MQKQGCATWLCIEIVDFWNKYGTKWVREAIFAESRSHRKSVRFTADICLAQIPWAPLIGRVRRCEQYPRQDWLDDFPSPRYHPQEAIEQGKVFFFSTQNFSQSKMTIWYFYSPVCIRMTQQRPVWQEDSADCQANSSAHSVCHMSSGYFQLNDIIFIN